MARRYEREVCEDELDKLSKHNIMSENLFNFFIHILQERKMILPAKSSGCGQGEGRVFLLTTTFYKALSKCQSDDGEINPGVIGVYAPKIVQLGIDLTQYYSKMLVPIVSDDNGMFSLAEIDFQKYEMIYICTRVSELVHQPKLF